MLYRVWSWAVAGELVNEIIANASILTGSLQALINVMLTVSSIEACNTATFVTTNQVLMDEENTCV